MITKRQFDLSRAESRLTGLSGGFGGGDVEGVVAIKIRSAGAPLVSYHPTEAMPCRPPPLHRNRRACFNGLSFIPLVQSPNDHIDVREAYTGVLDSPSSVTTASRSLHSSRILCVH